VPEDSLYDYLTNNYAEGSRGGSNSFISETAEFIHSGATLPVAAGNFIGLSAAVLAEDQNTQSIEKDARVAIAHKLIGITIGLASCHESSVVFQPQWYEYHSSNTKLVVRNGQPDVRKLDDQRLFDLSPAQAKRIKRLGPLIKCPAHKLPFSSETALELALHASINLADDRGHFDIAA
jgi:hypothetical protein